MSYYIIQNLNTDSEGGFIKMGKKAKKYLNKLDKYANHHKNYS